MITLTRRYRFSASHRLHAVSLNEQQNEELYGKCNNPFGHGHNYILDVSVEGPVDGDTGKLLITGQLDELVDRAVLKHFEHRNINLDLPEFQKLVPTTENISVVIARMLADEWPSAMPLTTSLSRLAVEETARNSFEIVWKR